MVVSIFLHFNTFWRISVIILNEQKMFSYRPLLNWVFSLMQLFEKRFCNRSLQNLLGAYHCKQSSIRVHPQIMKLPLVRQEPKYPSQRISSIFKHQPCQPVPIRRTPCKDPPEHLRAASASLSPISAPTLISSPEN